MTYQPYPDVSGVSKVNYFASMLVYTSFTLILYAT